MFSFQRTRFFYEYHITESIAYFDSYLFSTNNSLSLYELVTWLFLTLVLVLAPALPLILTLALALSQALTLHRF